MLNHVRRVVPERIKGVQRYVRNAIDRRRHPDRFVQHSSTPYNEIYRDGIMAVRHYQPLEVDEVFIEGQAYTVQWQQYRRPLVLVPPLGVFAWIFDLMIERSLVRYLLAHGFDVYLIDWGNPKDPPYQNLTLEDYVLRWFPQAMQAIRQHAGREDVSLMGYCMGGLLAMLYLSACRDTQVTGLVTIASPVDTHKMGVAGQMSAALQLPTRLVRRFSDFRINNLDPARFHVPGKWVSFAFKMSSPLSPLTSYIDLLKNLGDTEYLVSYMSMNAWFNNMADYPGGTVQELIRKLGLYNRLAKGQIRIGNRLADFKDIECDLLAFAGASDAIVPMASAYKIMDVVSSRDKRFHLVPGGHAGVFTGAKAVSTTWAISVDWLAQRSGGLPDAGMS